MNLTPAQLHTLRHMLGINTPGDKIPKPYRNYAAVSPDDQKFVELESLGAVRFYRETFGLKYYECTEAGKLAAMRSHRDIRYSKGQRVYLRFLDIRDCYSELTMKEFLTNPEYNEARRSA
jgi:hypothetical protein